MVGPSLAGVVGRKAGSVSGFAYSAGMKSSNLTWNEANLRRYLVDPHAVVPGGSMPAPGVNAQQAGEIVTYLKSL
ncbi:cytochrome c family protein [Aurantiacibacter xanthus]|uniref:Cytochrome c family protein n=2 Tax=Aurantiacibacter xanthus TaxID=1784712 RepID=A0A3A1P2W6_9SPHN|nr:cytochrome c family protein [Aurantiacibacter xanthus]